MNNSIIFALNNANTINLTESTMRIDPVEESPKYLAIADEIDKLIDEKFPKDKRRLGSNHMIWAYKKQMLKTKYCIDWHSPYELNPDIRFD